MMNTLSETLIKLLQKLIGFLQQRIQNSTQQSAQDKTAHHKKSINTLAPKVLTEQKELERLKPYLDDLKSAIDTSGINNIAVTGTYGSGKSTLLRTFQNQYPQYEYLNISLASFKDNKDDKSDDQVFERKLEISIIRRDGAKDFKQAGCKP